jgi:hypothetical protein
MTDDWTRRPPVEQELVLTRAVHAACLPVLAGGVDSLVARTRAWAEARLVPLAALEAALVSLCTELDDTPSDPIPADLLATLLPGLAQIPPQADRLDVARTANLVNFARRLIAPVGHGNYLATGIEWLANEGSVCDANQPVARLLCGAGVQVSAPERCRIAVIPRRLLATEGLSVAPGATLATLEPPPPIEFLMASVPAALATVIDRFHLAVDPDRPRIASDTTSQVAASALGAMGRWIRVGNESLKGLGGLNRTLDAGASYVDRQLRAVSLRNLQAAVADELVRIRLAETALRLVTECSDTVMAACQHRLGWLLGQVMQKTRELELRRAREAALLERDEASAAEVDTQVAEIATMATDLAATLERTAARDSTTKTGSDRHD